MDLDFARPPRATAADDVADVHLCPMLDRIEFMASAVGDLRPALQGLTPNAARAWQGRRGARTPRRRFRRTVEKPWRCGQYGSKVAVRRPGAYMAR